MKIRVFGDSHVGPLSRGWNLLRTEESAMPDAQPYFYASDGRYWLNCEVTETTTGFRISQARKGGKTLDDFVLDKNGETCFFSSPLHSAPLYRNRVWKTCCPWPCAVRGDALQALSSGIIEHWANEQVRHRVELLTKLRTAGISIVVVEPPKPLKRTPKMFGIRPDILSTASRMYRDYVFGFLAEQNIAVIRAPENTYEDTGFTKSKFAPKNLDDYHHGNALFGQEMMKTIMNVIAAERG